MAKASGILKNLFFMPIFLMIFLLGFSFGAGAVENTTITSGWGSSLTAKVSCQGGSGGISINWNSKGENGMNEYIRVIDPDDPNKSPPLVSFDPLTYVWWNGQNICSPGIYTYNVPNLEQNKQYTIEIGRQSCHQWCTADGCPRPGCSGNTGPGFNCDQAKDGPPQIATGTIFVKCPLTCYGKNGSYADFGTIPINNFGYFNDENGSSQTDADQSSGACTCMQGAIWDSNGKCCGDDTSDCGQIASGSICSVGTNSTVSNWIASATNLGDIRYLPCLNSEYLSDGSSWSRCNGPLWKKNVTSHEYICIGKGRQTVAECCGDGSCQSRIDGKRLATGQSAKAMQNQNNSNSSAGGSSSGITGMAVFNTKNKITGNAASVPVQIVDDVVTPGNAVTCSQLGSGWERIGIGHFCKHFTTFDKLSTNNQRAIEDIMMVGTPASCLVGWESLVSSQEVMCKKITTLSTTNTYTLLDNIESNGDQETGTCSPGWQGEGLSCALCTKYCKHFTTLFVQVSGQNQSTCSNGICESGESISCPQDCPSPTSGTGTGTIRFKATIDDMDLQSVDADNILFDYACSACGPQGQPQSQQGVPLRVTEINNVSAGIYNLTYASGVHNGTYFGSLTATDSDGNILNGNGIRAIAELKSGKSITFTFNFITSWSGSNATYYCRTDSIFVTDLDTPNSQLNDAALNNKNKKTCEKAGFVWTGTKCCSEDDDPHEYYNDPNGTGGCWDKKAIPSLSFVNGTNNSVGNYKGEFHGCAITRQDLLSITDTHTGSPLIFNHDHCFSDPENIYYCSFAGQWLLTDGADKSHLSYAPTNTSTSTNSGGCCSKDQCWDGGNCTANQRAKPLSQAINGFRCIDGNWTQSDIKESMDGSTFGYCPSNQQCLVNVFANNESAQCINSSQYINDNYCENGDWTSRTKLLALKLLKLKSTDYILFCDDRENALNNLQYLTGSGEIVGNVLSNLQTNNFCVLKSGTKIIAATSINKNLDNLSNKNLNIFGVNDCNSALTDDGQYHSCDSTNKVWFNKRLKSFIYSSIAINVPSEQESSSFIMNFIKSIIDAIKRLITNPPFDESYLNSIKRFYRLYMAEQAGKSIRGSIEGKTFRNAVIQYSGFDADICNFVNQFNQANNDISSGISCKKESNNYYVLAQGGPLLTLDPDTIWQDLTSKLRLK